MKKDERKKKKKENSERERERERVMFKKEKRESVGLTREVVEILKKEYKMII